MRIRTNKGKAPRTMLGRRSGWENTGYYVRGGWARPDIRYTSGITSGVRDQEQPRTMQEEARPPRQAVYLSQVLMGEGRKSDALSE